MKRTVAILLALILVLGVAVGLIACNEGGDEGAQFSDKRLQKIEQAFSGVEKSMNKDASLSAFVSAEKGIYLAGAESSASIVVDKAPLLAAGTTEADALSMIRSVFTAGDKQASAESIEYTQPPMMQFRYLKAIFEEMGDDYELGTKYYYDITGQMYFDMQTGYPVDAGRQDAAAYCYDYVFGFAISIELNEDDTIFAEVGFKINLTKGSEKYETTWYVSFDLDYDFDKDEPTYTLLMYTDNKESELPFLNRDQGYEYGYVEVNKGSIREWRKFVMDVDREITIGGKYASFEDYIAEGVGLADDTTAKWLKDGEYYKITRHTSETARTLAIAFVDGLGMNSTAINGGAFLAKSGKRSTVIDTYYKKICEVYGGDIIYDLVCKDEPSGKDGKDGSGGSGNGSNGGTGNWASVIPASFIGSIPTFETSSATFTLEVTDEGALIHVYDVGRDDYSRFGAALETAGFISQGNSNYFKTTAEGTLIVSINPDYNAIFIGMAKGESKKGVEIKYGVDYDGAFTAVSTQAVNDYYQIAAGVERDFNDKLNVKAMSGVCTGSMFYDITLAYTGEEGMTGETYAAERANVYGAMYMGGNWSNTYANTINRSVQEGKEVLVLISSSGSKSEAHLYIYVLLYEDGSVDAIMDVGNGGGGGVIDGGGGENGGGEIGGEGNGNEGGEVAREVNVTIHYLTSDKKEYFSEPRTYEEGQVIDFGGILSEPGQTAYPDPSCERAFDGEVKAYAGLNIYVWAESKEPETPELYDIKIYNVVNGEVPKEPSEKKQTILGETDYYGDSFGYVVYWDAACREQVPIDYRFTMTEDGITLYRDMTVDYVVVKTDFYLNNVLYEHREGFYRKGLVYHVINNNVLDVDYYTTFDRTPAYYLGEGRREEDMIAYGDTVAFTADQTNIYVYATNKDYGVYTVTAGGKELGEVATNQPQYVDSFGAIVAKSHEVSGTTIILHEAKTYNTYRHYSVWKDRMILAEETYFDEPFEIMEEGAKPGAESKIYFQNASCTTPITYNEEGFYVVSSTTNLYSPYAV